MTEINVLVSGNVTPKGKGGGIPKEENSGTDPAAMEFAAIFGGWMAQAMGQGQDSGLQSSDPAGKEANSGQTGIQGLEGMLGTLRTVAGLNWGLTNEETTGREQQGLGSMIKSLRPEIMTLLSQENLLEDATDTGIGSGQLQTVKLPLSELDQYRVLITQLLQEMSGEISKVSIKPAEIQGLLTQLSQELNLNTSTMKVEQSSSIGEKTNVQATLLQLLQTQPDLISSQLESNQRAVSQEKGISVDQSESLSNSQTGLKGKIIERTIESTQNSKFINQNNDRMQNLAAESNLSSEKTAVQAMPLIRNVTQALNLPQDSLAGQTQDGIEQEGLSTANHQLDMSIKTEAGQTGTGKEKQNFLGNEKVSTISKDAATEVTNSNLGNINLSHVSSNSVTEIGNKTTASQNSPIWQQVAQELQTKVLNQLPTIREFNIQLHPEELGQISISVALDNGQVHFQMRASEAATGQILQSSFPELRESLSQSGVQCGMMQMSFADSNPNFKQGKNQNFNSQNKNQDNQGSDIFYGDEVREAISALSHGDHDISQSYRINVTA